MPSPHYLLLAAKRCDIDDLTHLATTCDIVGDISRFIHVLQRERGAANIYLASNGNQFGSRCDVSVEESQAAEAQLRKRLDAMSRDSRPLVGARLLRRIAAAWFALDELATMRRAIKELALSPDAATQRFNQLISGLLSIVFEAADSTADPDITHALVAIFHFMQGKELAGQERACGAFGFATGHFDDAHRTTLVSLVDAQQRCFDTFIEFADSEARQQWQRQLSTRTLSGIQQLREIAAHRTQPTDTPDTLAETWYELTTLRIDSMKLVEDHLTHALSQMCHTKIAQAQEALAQAKAEPHKQHTSSAPCQQLMEMFKEDSSQALGSLTAEAVSSPLSRSLIELTQAQSTRLQSLSDELENTRKALRERKLVERAKGLIMAHQDMSEEEAYRFLRKTSMDQSKSMADMARAILDLSSMLQKKETGA
ncbi:nitrate- and nitrite sensing domain-containing protein [Halomonas sp. Bachu 37]|uniref:nitrate- and nitrite sensing domain-containing protein n=1 Tax=Halomonas kashgarensis TaxID=3084920 RepID=UPI003217AA43